MTHFQPQLIEDAGFSAEEHTVITEDGYLLTIHRFLLLTLREIFVSMTEPAEISKPLSYNMSHTELLELEMNQSQWFSSRYQREDILLFFNFKAVLSPSDLNLPNNSSVFFPARAALLVRGLGDWGSRQSLWFPSRRRWL